MFKKLITLVVVSLLVACSTIDGVGGATSPAQAVFQAKQDYAIALTAAVAYKNLPPCNVANATAVCSKISVVLQLQKADDAAAALLAGAETTVRTGGSNTAMAIQAAQQAVLALTSITKTLGQ